MSTPPPPPPSSAFDVLMANSRGKQQPSPNKRKQPSPIPISPQSSNGANAAINWKEFMSNSSEGNKKAKSSITPDDSVAELRKKATNFDVKKAAYWGKGETMPFMFFVKAIDAISEENGRNCSIEIACNMLRTVIETAPENLVSVMCFMASDKSNNVNEGLELGLGDALIVKALAEAYGCKELHIRKKYEELGDLGLVAKASRSSQSLLRKPEALTLAKVFDTFQLIAKESGQDSQEKKKNHIKGLLVAATDCEPQYLIRLLQSNLRIGLAKQNLLAALGHAAVYSEKHSSPKKVDSSLEEAAKIVKQVYSVFPVYDKIVSALLSGGVWNLPKMCSLSPGIPIGPMRSKSITGLSQIIEKFKNVEYTCEYKYDGERAQIHYLENGTVEIFSRNSERNAGKFPDVVATITRLKQPFVTSFILDCEIVAYDLENHRVLPFQILSTRAKKNVVMSEIKVHVCIYAFDILYLNGQQLIQEQLNVRREHLYKSFQEEDGFLQFATYTISNDLREVENFLYKAVNSSCEGLVIKTLNKDATYEPSKKSIKWLKLKKDYMEGIGDSLDLVPIAAFHGKGKRTGVYGAFLLACYDADKKEYQSICKIATGDGFSEAVLEERYASLNSTVIDKPKSDYRYSDISTDKPDVWFEPTQVWEVKCADLIISRKYCAGIGAVYPAKGISLRFPRWIRVREDKNPEQATSSDRIAEMYKEQKSIHLEKSDESDDAEVDDL